MRVACPARGTLLASRRLDAYLSVLKWATDLAGIPAAPGFIEFLAEIARRRTDPAQLPGLAAQIPDSPLIQWLHSGGRPLPGELRVVAGDIDGDSVTSWVKTLLADALLLDRQRPRRADALDVRRLAAKTEATFLLDEGGRVSHFNYFANDRTARCDRECAGAGPPAGFRRDWSAVVERHVRDRHARRAAGIEWFAGRRAGRR